MVNDTALQQLPRLLTWLAVSESDEELAALRNMLPWLVELAEWLVQTSALSTEPIAQRILDAARAELTPEQYAEATQP